MNKIRVAVIDDHPLFRHGVVNFLARQTDIEVVGEGESASDAVEIAGTLSPDVIIVDLDMPGDGLLAVEAIGASYPTVSILVLSVVVGEEQVRRSLEKGARGYLLKGSGGEEVSRTVRSLYRGESYVSPILAAHLIGRIAQTNVRESTWAALSPRQQQVGALVGDGMSNKHIAAELGLTEGTVKSYIAQLMHKLRARNRTEVALILRKSHGAAPRIPFSQVESRVEDHNRPLPWRDH